MITRLFSRYRQFRGIGDASPAIPPLDGPFNPNQVLEQAQSIAQAAAIDNLAITANGVEYSTLNKRFSLSDTGSPKQCGQYDAPITAMTRGIVALQDGKIINSETGDEIATLEGDVTALISDKNGDILACVGSTANSASDWQRDLLEKRRAGALWRINLETGAKTLIIGGLAFPNGLVLASNGDVIVAESWKNQLIRVAPNGDISPIKTDLPGYPARLSPAATGGAWLAMMAPRNQLLEFVLREDAYRARMLAEVQPDNWIAPLLAPPTSFLQPMQQGAQRSLGRLKPWSPGFSLGFVVRFDADWQPQFSLFSRADGTRHGVTCIVEQGGDLLVASKGSGQLLRVSKKQIGELA